MFSGVWLDTAIGVAFVFLSLSLIVTAAVEIVAQVIGWRAKTLKSGVANLLQSMGLRGDKTKSNPWLVALYDHSLIRGLYDPKGLPWANGNKPSYIPSAIFSNALIDIVTTSSSLLALRTAQSEWTAAFGTQGDARQVIGKLLASRDAMQGALVQALDAIPAALAEERRRATERIALLRKKKDLELNSGLKDKADATAVVLGWAESKLSALDGDLRKRVEALVSAFGSGKLVARLAASWKAIETAGTREDIEAEVKRIDGWADQVSLLLADLTSDIDRTLNRGVDLIDKIEIPELRNALRSMVGDVQATVDDVRKAVADWFDASMERVGGWYKRRMELCGFGIGLLVAVLLNADALHIVGTMSRDSELRQSFVLAAGKLDGGSSSDMQKQLMAHQKDIQAQLSTIPMGWYKAACVLRSDGKTPCGSADKEKDRMVIRSKTPASAADISFEMIVANVGLSTILGWLLTAMALKLGAPFWFDLLSMLMKMRGTGASSSAQQPQRRDAVPSTGK